MDIDIPFENHRESTCLRQLTLIECNISVATMGSLLSLPSALQSLDITNRRALHRPLKKVSLESLIRILVLHQPKLESLTYANTLEYGYYSNQFEGSEVGLSSLSQLKYLALPYDNGKRSRHLGNLMRHISPTQSFASLETALIGVELRKHEANSTLSYHRNLGLQSSRCPRLRTLIVALGNLGDMYEGENSENKKLPFLEDFEKRLLEDYKGSKVRIILQETIHHHYVPPYLFGEKAPERRTVFDSGAEEVMAGSST